MKLSAALRIAMLWAVGIPVVVLMAYLVAMGGHASAQADGWTGPDKGKHLAVGAAIGAGVTAITSSTAAGVAAGAAVGVLKEAYDSRRPGSTASARDAIVTAAGAMLGAHVAGVFISARGLTITRPINLW